MGDWCCRNNSVPDEVTTSPKIFVLVSLLLPAPSAGTYKSGELPFFPGLWFDDIDGMVLDAEARSRALKGMQKKYT